MICVTHIRGRGGGSARRFFFPRPLSHISAIRARLLAPPLSIQAMGRTTALLAFLTLIVCCAVLISILTVYERIGARCKPCVTQTVTCPSAAEAERKDPPRTEAPRRVERKHARSNASAHHPAAPPAVPKHHPPPSAARPAGHVGGHWESYAAPPAASDGGDWEYAAPPAMHATEAPPPPSFAMTAYHHAAVPEQQSGFHMPAAAAPPPCAA